MKRLLFIYNPHAGKKRIAQHLHDVVYLFATAGYEVTVHPTLFRGDATRTAAELGDQYDHIVCCGGDGTLNEVVKSLYGEDAVTRFRPHHFPFTEPSCEMDMQCHKCHGTGEIDGQVCSTCHGEGWIELLGAGMVHPTVLENCGIDPEKYSGFAFGMGLERMAMGRMKINDLRLIFDNDIRFLNQF